MKTLPYKIIRSKKQHGGQHKIDPSNYQHIVNLYASGKFHREIAKICGVNKRLISKILKERGVPFRANKQYELREDWLSVVDSPQKAYFLGYFWADGNMEKNGRTCKITLQKSDRYILEWFRDWIYVDKCRPLTSDFHDYKKYKGRRAKKYSLKICSKRFWDDLKKLGCMPAKSLIIDFPSFFEDEKLLWHFIRGLFDGDGCISRRQNKRFEIHWVGSPKLCQGLSGFLNSKGFSCKLNKTGKNLVAKMTRIKDLVDIFPFLYGGSLGMRLERKFNRFKVASKDKYKIRPISIYERKSGKLVIRLDTSKEAVRYLNISISALRSYYGKRLNHPEYIIKRKGYND